MKKSDTRLRWLVLVLSLMAVLAVSIGGYLYLSTVIDFSVDRAHKEASADLESLGIHIDSYLEWSLTAVESLAGLKELKRSLVSKDAIAQAETNEILDHFKDTLKADVCYLMDRNGNTIASSNRDAADSFVGNNFGFRPYFQQAMKGIPSVYVAVGVTSKKRGIYFSHPVYGKGREGPLGVAAVKASVEWIEKALMKTHDGIISLTNPHGVVFVSNRAQWDYHLLWEDSSDTIADIAGTRQFGNGPWHWTGVTLPIQADQGCGAF